MADVFLEADMKASSKLAHDLKAAQPKQVIHLKKTAEGERFEKFQQVIQEASRIVAQAVIAGQNLPRGAPQAPPELLLRFGGELGRCLDRAYRLGVDDAEGRKPKKEI